MDGLTVIAQVSQASSPFLLALAVWAFASGRVVPRWIFDRETQRADEWKALAQSTQRTADRSLTVAEKAGAA